MSDLVPNGWNFDFLSAFIEINPSFDKTLKLTDNTDVSFIKMEDVSNSASVKNLRRRKYSEVKKGFTKFINNDVLVAKITPCFENGKGGHVKGLTNGIGFGSTEFHVFRAKENSDSSYFFHFSNYPTFRLKAEASMCGTGGQRRVQTDFFRTFKTTYPPLPEQQKIAAILSSVDEVIEKTQAQIKKLKDLKTGMMQELLSPREGQAANINNPQGESKNGLHHAEFKDSPLGRIPVGWEVVTSGSVCTLITKGTTPTSLGFSFQDTGINFIKVESITPSGVINKHKFSYIDDATHNALARSKIHNGDILITIAGATVGKLAIVNESHLPANTNQALAIVRVDENEIRRKFLYYWLQSDYIFQEIECIQTVGAQPNLSLAQIGGFNVALPSLNEQDAITDVLNAIDNKINLYSKKLDSKVLIKKALMQDLLTGKVRVQVDAS